MACKFSSLLCVTHFLQEENVFFQEHETFIGKPQADHVIINLSYFALKIQIRELKRKII